MLVHNLSIQLDTNQTHMEVYAKAKNCYKLNLLQLLKYVIDEWDR
jgi:hypothetical protein